MPRLPKRMGTLFVGEEQSVSAKRLRKIDSHLTVANAHSHHCATCQRDWYCWCHGGTDVDTGRQCLDCHHEASLPKVMLVKDGLGNYRESRLFSRITVSQGGWTSQWVSTRELRAALRRWIESEYKANPPEVSEQAGPYQCGGCRFFLALDSDYGICANTDSPYDGRIVFEHIGCKANPFYVANHKEHNDDARE